MMPILASELLTTLSDLSRVIVVVLFALFIGGAMVVHYHYRRKNRSYRSAHGRDRPMFRHVMLISVGSILASISAVMHNIDNLGDPITAYVPLNFVAFFCLWRAMVAMIREVERRDGWLKSPNGDPEDEPESGG